MSKKENFLALNKESVNLALGINSGAIKLAQIEMGLDIKNTLDKKNIRTVFKGQESVAFTAIETLVIRFMDSFGFSTKPTDNQIEMLAVDTFEKFAYESLTDVILFFKMARSGKFGETNRGVDSNLLYGKWFPMYLEQKAVLREQNYQKEKGETSRMQATDEDVKSTYDKIAKTKRKKQIEAYVDKITKDFDKQLLEDLIVDWEKDKERKDWVYLLKEKRKSFRK
jgi:hypothetical protein